MAIAKIGPDCPGPRLHATDRVTRAGGIPVYARCVLTALPSARTVALATATFAR